MELRGVAHVGVELAVELVLVGFLDDVVEGDVGEETGGQDRSEARRAAHGGAVRICDSAKGESSRQRSTGSSANLPCARLSQDRPAGGVGGVGADDPVSLGVGELAAVLVAEAEQQVGGVAHPTVEGVEIVVAAVRAGHVAIVAADLQPAEVLAGDEVGHAADGVRAVGGRSAVLQHLDPADGRLRQEVGVGLVAGEALAVQEHQGPLGAEAADVDGAAAVTALGVGRELVGVAQHRAGDGQGLDDVEDGGRAALLQVFLVQDRDRDGGILGRTLDEGAGDDDFLDRVGPGVLRLGGARRHEACCNRDGRRAVKITTLHPVPSPIAGGLIACDARRHWK